MLCASIRDTWDFEKQLTSLCADGPTYLQAAQQVILEPDVKQLETHAVRAKKNRLFLRYSQENRRPITPLHPLMLSPVVKGCLVPLDTDALGPEKAFLDGNL
jgi:hypothetical protein